LIFLFLKIAIDKFKYFLYCIAVPSKLSITYRVKIVNGRNHYFFVKNHDMKIEHDVTYGFKISKTNKLIYVGHLDPVAPWEGSNHYHPYHELVVILKGTMFVEISKKHICANAGDILFYNAGVNHFDHPDNSNPPELIFLTWREKGKLDFPILTHDINKKIRFLAQWLYEKSQPVSPYRNLLQKNIFEVILSELSEISKSKESHPVVTNIRSFMREHIKEHLTLENLAKYAGMSKNHFLITYKKLTGQTPMDDLRIIRVETAKDMIFTTDLPLKAISKEVGFIDEYQLSKVFKKYIGTPPGKFRKKTISP
jgi:AraC-like DNA-binding protein/mannose-6-phosphate isomerase-like protein (cupin superfamily)